MMRGAINQVAVIGAGRMGHGIAQVFAAGGCCVRCFDDDPAARDSLGDRVRQNLARMASVGLVESAAVDRTVERVQVAGSLAEAVRDADFVIEAIVENAQAKEDLLVRVEAVVDRHTILASNSSTYPISQTGARLRHRDRALVVHFINPPYIIPAVEVVAGPQTSEEVVDACVALLRRAGKRPIRIHKELPGFLINRVQVAMYREVFALLEAGVVSRQDMDAAISGALGFRLAISGPLRVMDFGGLNVWERVYQNLVGHIESGTELPGTLRELAASGQWGPSTGKGLFDYSSVDKQAMGAVRDQRLMQLLKLIAAFMEDDQEHEQSIRQTQ